MEVHHHPDLHNIKKKFKEYFFEFLMIFLAVTLGFFAEQIRENVSENSQAKELAKSLYQVLADSLDMQYRISLRHEKEKQMDYFRKYVTDSDLVILSVRFYPSFFWSCVVTSAIQFIPNDGILNQLRNSGSLRYFKNIELQDAISKLNVAILNLRSRNSQEDAFTEDFTRPFIQKYYDFDWEDELSQHGKMPGLQGIFALPTFHGAQMPRIRNLKEFDRNNAEALATNFLMVIRITVLLDYNPYIEANHRLLEVLRKEFDINNN